MFSTSRSVRRSLAAVALTAAMGGVLASAPGASAATGELYTTDGPMATAHDLRVLTSTGYVQTIELTGGAIQVKANPSIAGDQTVYLQYVVQRREGTQWMVVTQSTSVSGTVSGEGTVTLSKPSWAYSLAGQTGDFRVSYRLRWSSTADATVTFATTVAPAVAGDTRCSVIYVNCTAYTTFINTTGRRA